MQLTPGPAGAAYAGPQSGKYELKPCSAEHSEAIFLRNGDVISYVPFSDTLTFTWNDSEVQVNSSAVEVVETSKEQIDAAKALREENDVEEDLDQNVIAVSATQARSTQPKSQQSRGTPRLSNQRSLIVQETPTAARVNRSLDISFTSRNGDSHFETVATTQPPSFTENGEMDEPFSTARTGKSQHQDAEHLTAVEGDSEPEADSNALPGSGALPSGNQYAQDDDTTSKHTARPQPYDSSPRVIITPTKSSKRLSPATEEVETGSEVRPSKRAKVCTQDSEDTQDSRMSNIIVDTTPRKNLPKTRKRISEASEDEEEAPQRSQRSSQRSNQNGSEAYNSPPPRVAFSNSAIAPSSQAVRFLRKKKGSIVDSVNDNCNVLW